MVTQFFAPVTGGEERLVEDLRDALGARGHHVSVATTTESTAGPFEGDARVHRVRTTMGRLPGLHADDARRHTPPFPDPEAVLSLRRIIAEERPDVVHCHNWLVHSTLPALGRSGTPLILTLHDYGQVCANKRLTRDGRVCEGPRVDRCLPCSRDHYGSLKGLPTALVMRPASALVLRRVDMFLPISDAVAGSSGLVGSGRPYEVIPDFVPDALLEPAPAGLAPSGLPEGDFIVFAGDVSIDKGIGPLLDAHAQLPHAPPLVVVGRILPDQIDARRPNVLVLGPRPHAELMEIFRRSLAVMVPSVWAEPFGLVALEGMAMGRPVVASDVGGLATMLEDGVSGILVPPGDVAGLAAAMERLCGSAELRERMGRAAAERARRFSASAIVPRVEGVYRSLVRDAALRAPVAAA